MKRNNLLIFKSQEDLYLNFENNNYDMIIVTGISGSGKSHTSNMLSKRYQLPIVSFDYIYGYEKDRNPNNLEVNILASFYKQHPQYTKISEEIRLGKKDELNVKDIDNLFFDFVLEYIKAEKLQIIFDGSYFLTSIDCEKFKNQRIVVKRTSLIKSMYQRTKRTIRRNEYNKVLSIYRSIKINLFNMIKWYHDINSFLSNWC